MRLLELSPANDGCRIIFRRRYLSSDACVMRSESGSYSVPSFFQTSTKNFVRISSKTRGVKHSIVLSIFRAWHHFCHAVSHVCVVRFVFLLAADLFISIISSFGTTGKRDWSSCPSCKDIPETLSTRVERCCCNYSEIGIWEASVCCIFAGIDHVPATVGCVSSKPLDNSTSEQLSLWAKNGGNNSKLTLGKHLR